MASKPTPDHESALTVLFYATPSGTEPVREWLQGLDRDTRKAIGVAIRAVQIGWPLGMPLVRKMGPGLWEVRSNIPSGIARVMFTVTGEGQVMLLTHGFVKKSQQTPRNEMDTALARLKDYNERMKK